MLSQARLPARPVRVAHWPVAIVHPSSLHLTHSIRWQSSPQNPVRLLGTRPHWLPDTACADQPRPVRKQSPSATLDSQTGVVPTLNAGRHSPRPASRAVEARVASSEALAPSPVQLDPGARPRRLVPTPGIVASRTAPR